MALRGLQQLNQHWHRGAFDDTRPEGAAFDGTVQHSMALRGVRQLEQMALRGILWHSTDGVAFDGTAGQSVALDRWRGIRWHSEAFDSTSKHSTDRPDGTVGIRK